MAFRGKCGRGSGHSVALESTACDLQVSSLFLSAAAVRLRSAPAPRVEIGRSNLLEL